MHFITGKHLPAGRSCAAWAPPWPCPSWMRWCRPARPGAAAAADPTRLICIEEVHGQAGCNVLGATKNLFAPAATGRDFTLIPDKPAHRARALPRLHDHRQQHRRADGRGVRGAGNRRRPLPVERGVPDAVASEADAGLGHLGRHVARSDVREAVRPGDADAVDAVLHREPRPGRRLHLQLLVRLHRLDQLGVAERAAADDPRPARSRSTCCSDRAARRKRARRRRATRKSILDWVQGEVADAQAPPGRGRPHAHRPLPRERPGDRTPHQDGRGAEHERRGARNCRTRPRACPTRSPSTCG